MAVATIQLARNTHVYMDLVVDGSNEHIWKCLFWMAFHSLSLQLQQK